jgi:hypothetical protein
MSWCRLLLDRGSGLLAYKLASPWHYLWLGGGLLSMIMRLLPPLTSTTFLEGDAGIRPQRCHP